MYVSVCNGIVRPFLKGEVDYVLGNWVLLLTCAVLRRRRGKLRCKIQSFTKGVGSRY